MKKKIRLLYILLLYCAGGVAADENALLKTSFLLDIDSLVNFSFDSFLPHEATPEGVPTTYDWATKPRLGAGNNPGGFLVATGWGQVFYAKGNDFKDLSSVAIRNFQTYVCYESSGVINWFRQQNEVITGSQFRADYIDNKNEKPISFKTDENYAEIAFKRGTAFHFWPKSGRFELLNQSVCGVLVLLEAKQTMGAPNTLLVGLGADYWRTRTAVWDHYKTNKDIAIGRLKMVRPDWQWVGLTTASGDALNALKQSGFSLPNQTSNTAK